MLYVNSGSNKNVLMLMLHITTVPNLLSHKDTMKWVGVLILSKKMTGQVILQWKKTHFQNAFLSHFVYPTGPDCVHNLSVAKLLILDRVRIIFPSALLTVHHIQQINIEGCPWMTVLQ